MIRAEFFDNRPLSGEYEEINFSPDKYDLIWVKFTDSSGGEWCGIFGVGLWTAHSKILIVDKESCLVLAKGILYLVNVESKKLLRQFQRKGLRDIVKLGESDHVLATDDLGLFLMSVSTDKLLWQSKRFALDNIKFEAADENKVTGKFDDFSGEWHDFTFFVDTKEIVSDRGQRPRGWLKRLLKVMRRES